MRLRPFTLDDVAAVHAFQSREEVTRWIYWSARSRDEVQAALREYIAMPTESGVVLAVEVEGALIGQASLAVRDHRQGEIGFLLHPDHQGHGYATQAAEALLELGFGTYALHRVYGRIEPRNIASGRVLERLGMRKEAHLIENEWVKGEWQSEAVYAILAREWREARGRR